MDGWTGKQINPGLLALKKKFHNNTGNGAQVKGAQNRLIDLEPKKSLRRALTPESLGRRKFGSVFTTVFPNPSTQDSGLYLQ